MVEIFDYRPEHQPWFEALNREWIERHFWMEPLDVEVLRYPDKHILEKGGVILMASSDQQIAGTVALKFVTPGVYEFTKMAVDNQFRGKGIGTMLARAALKKAGKLGAEKIILYSSTKLEPAIALYRKLGFVEVPVDGPYKRSDIKMELTLPATDDSFKISVATTSDIPLLANLGAKTFEEAFGPYNTEENMHAYIKKAFAVPQLQADFQEPGSIFLLATHHDQPVGYVKLRTAVLPEGLENEKPVEIERIYVTKTYVGKQVGRVLLEACVTRARENNHRVIWLGVWEHNARAIAFYKKFGFQQFGAQPFMLGSDLQTDLLMKKMLV
jgi:ribosomal protein S18 acetylase RimI-like enzyme